MFRGTQVENHCPIHRIARTACSSLSLLSLWAEFFLCEHKDGNLKKSIRCLFCREILLSLCLYLDVHKYFLPPLQIVTPLISLGINFNNIVQAAFSYKSIIGSFLYLKFVFVFIWQKRLLVKRWWQAAILILKVWFSIRNFVIEKIVNFFVFKVCSKWCFIQTKF